MFGKLARGAGWALKLAGPAVGGALAGGPGGAALAVTSQVTAALDKRAGKRRETFQGKAPTQKITTPLVAMGVPAGVAAIAAQFGLDLSGGLGVICAGGELTAAGFGFLMGVLALLSHLLGHGLQDATRRR